MIACVIFGELRFIENTHNMIKNSFPNSSIHLYFDVQTKSRKSADHMSHHIYTDSEYLINEYFGNYTKYIYIDENSEYDNIINHVYPSYNMKILGTNGGFYSTYRIERSIKKIADSEFTNQYTHIICMRTDTVCASKIELNEMEPYVWYGIPNIYLYGEKDTMCKLFIDMHQTFKYIRDNKINADTIMVGEAIIEHVSNYKSLMKMHGNIIIFYGVFHHIPNNESCEHVRFGHYYDYNTIEKMTCNTTYDINITLTKKWASKLCVRSGYYDFYGKTEQKYQVGQTQNVINIFGSSDMDYNKIFVDNNVFNIIILVKSEKNETIEIENNKRLEIIGLSDYSTYNFDDYIYEARHIIDNDIPLTIVNHTDVVQDTNLDLDNSPIAHNISSNKKKYYDKGSDFIQYYRNKYYRTT